MQSVISCNCATPPTIGATSYCQFQASVGVFNSTITNVESVMPIDGVIDHLYVQQSTAAGSGKAYTYTLMVNGVAVALAAALSNSTTGNSGSQSISVSKGDRVALRLVIDASSAAITYIDWGYRFTATVSGESLVCGGATGSSSPGANSTFYFGLQAQNLENATETNVYSIMPTAGVFDNLYFNSDVAPGVLQTYTATLVLNGTPTTLSAVLSGAAQVQNNDSNGAHAVAVVAGDKVSYQWVSSLTAAATSHPNFGARFVPTVNGESLGFASHNTTLIQNTTQYRAVTGRTGFSATEANRQGLITETCTIKKLYTEANPSNGQTFAALLRDGGINTFVTCTVTGNAGGTAQTVSDLVNTYAAVNGSLISVRGITSATSGTITNATSLVYYIAPPPASGKLFGRIAMPAMRAA